MICHVSKRVQCQLRKSLLFRRRFLSSEARAWALRDARRAVWRRGGRARGDDRAVVVPRRAAPRAGDGAEQHRRRLRDTAKALAALETGLGNQVTKEVHNSTELCPPSTPLRAVQACRLPSLLP